MKLDEITVPVNAKLSVDKRTAEACLKLLEIYLNGTGANVVARRGTDGALSFELIDSEEDPKCKNCGYKIHSERISNSHDCNDCSRRPDCEFLPQNGNVRVNCYHWKGEIE